MKSEQIIRRAYEVAERVDIKGWVECFTPDGTFTDMSINVTFRGPEGPTGPGYTVEKFARAFPDMHRELYRFFTVGDDSTATHPGPWSWRSLAFSRTSKRRWLTRGECHEDAALNLGLPCHVQMP